LFASQHGHFSNSSAAKLLISSLRLISKWNFAAKLAHHHISAN